MAAVQSGRMRAQPAAAPLRRALPWAAGALALLLLALSAVRVIGQIEVALGPGDDFRQYWNGATSLLVGESPYAWLDRKTSQDNQDYVYPPLLAILFVPIVHFLDYATARWLWLGFSVLCLALGLGLTWRVTGVRLWGPWALAPLALAVLWPSITWALALGQISPQLLLVLAAALAALLARRAGGGGALLALATWLKVFPALLGGYLLLRRQWRAALAAVGGGLALAAGSVLIVGWEPHWTYLTRAITAYRRWLAADYNQSLTGFFIRLFAANDFSVPVVDSFLLAQAAIWASSLAIVALSAYAIWRAPTTRDGAAAGYAVALTASLLVSPMTGHYLFMLAIVPLGVAIARVHAAWPRHLGWLLLALILLALPWEYCTLDVVSDWCHSSFAVVPDDLPWRQGWGNVLIAGPMYGLLALWALLVRLCLEPGGTGAPASALDAERAAVGTTP